MQGGRDVAPQADALAAATQSPVLSAATSSSTPAATTMAVGTTMEELAATSAAVGTTTVELGVTSPPLVMAPTAGALSLLQAADALGRLDATPTSSCAPPDPSPSLVVDAPSLTGVDTASLAPVLDGDSAPSTSLPET
ncbi:uncharacterized protein [Miscanthus floridulus]|uniref:uncharacterized protein n=1 Tax=Miscanthus floridulus TaxID=154761 RepID=UPI003458F1BD